MLSLDSARFKTNMIESKNSEIISLKWRLKEAHQQVLTFQYTNLSIRKIEMLKKGRKGRVQGDNATNLCFYSFSDSHC